MIETDYVQLTPFMPPVEDVVMQMVSSTGAKCYICDTYCKNPMTPEEKAEKDRRILEIYARAERKKLLRKLQEERERQA